MFRLGSFSSKLVAKIRSSKIRGGNPVLWEFGFRDNGVDYCNG